MDLHNCRRIIIVGSGGSGKSTYARKLGNITGIPVIHLDKEYWKPNWTETPKPEWIDKQNHLIQKDSWIIDGNFGGTMEIRFNAADTIIFLDINRWVCLFSVFKRWLTNFGKTRIDVGEGCPERIKCEFLKWIYTFLQNGRKKILFLIDLHKDKNIIIFKNRNEMKVELDNLQVH